MKVLGIVGSKRKQGNTATLVKAALEAAEIYGAETHIEYLSDYKISGCTGCEACRNTFKCTINDDMQNLYPHIFIILHLI